jgi:carbonic anhydrase
VLKQPVTASAAQIQRLAVALGHPNNRPVQPIGARVVLK